MNPSLGPEEVAYILRQNILDLGPPGRDLSFGYGLCKGGDALSMAPGVITVRNFDRGVLTDGSDVVSNGRQEIP
jgi:hypothetical protein